MENNWLNRVRIGWLVFWIIIAPPIALIYLLSKYWEYDKVKKK